jgi:hypothetical protein
VLHGDGAMASIDPPAVFDALERLLALTAGNGAAIP